MKRIKIKNKKILLIIVFLFVLTIGVTYAYFNSEDVFENRFNAMKYDVSIEEEFYNTWGTKKVKFRNNDSAPVVIRISYNELWSLKENITNSGSCRYNVTEDNGETLFTLSNKINGVDVVTKNWTEEWSSFINGNDGWYYYSKVLDVNDEVQILNSIELNEDLIRESSCYKNYNDFGYELSFNYEVIQADKNAISEIWGYDVNISEGNIAWTF